MIPRSVYVPTLPEIEYQLSHPGESRQPSVIAAIVVLLVVAYIAVALRCLARYKTKVRFGTDDVLIVLALIVSTGYVACLSIELGMGLARHVVFLKHYRAFVITNYISVAFFALATALTKASILSFYCRVFRNKRLVQFSWVFNIFVAAYSIGAFLSVLLECLPISSTWTLGGGGRCYSIKPPIIFLGCVNIVVDFGILAIPIRFVLRLHMDKIRKLQVCGIFFSGILTCIFAIIRTVTFAATDMHDVTYDLTYPSIFTLCEISIGILTACLPTIGFFFSKNHPLSISSTVRNAWSRRSTPWNWDHRNRLNLRLPSSDDIHEKTDPSPTTPAPAVTISSPIAGQVLSIPLMMSVDKEEPRCLLEVNIPCSKLHRHSANTDTITHFTTDEYGSQMSQHLRGNFV